MRAQGSRAPEVALLSVVVTAAVLVGALAAPARGGQCPAGAEDAWKQVSSSLGLSVIEPGRHLVGSAPGITKTWALANDFLGIDQNWHPLDIERKTLCGFVDRWSMFEHWFSGAEHDLHAHVLPFPEYAYLLEEAVPIAGELDHARDCDQHCEPSLYSEITPARSLRRGRDRLVEGSGLGLPRDPVPFTAIGRLACVYGPWVREEFHANIPEIHPSEIFWGIDPAGNHETVRSLLVVRDRSRRFDEARHFAWTPGPWWKPWTSAGDFEVRVAVRAEPSGETVLRIKPVRPSTGSAAGNDLVTGGTVRVVDETGVFEEAQFERLCPDTPEDHRGFITLRGWLDDTGFLAATLEIAGGSLPRLPEVPDGVAPVSLAVPAPIEVLERGSLRRVDGRLQGTFVSEGDGGEARSEEKPVELDAVGAVAKIQPVAVRVKRRRPAVLPRTAELWGLNAVGPAREWRVAVRLRAELVLFLQVRSAERGESEILAEEVASVLRDERRRRELFGTERPFAVHWDRLEVVDLETGERIGNEEARTAGIGIRCYEGDLGSVGSCFPTDTAPALRPAFERVGVLGGVHFDFGGRNPAHPPATLKVVVSGRVTGPLEALDFEQTFLNHSPTDIEEGRLTVPRAWQLDEHGLAPGLLTSLAGAIWGEDAPELVQSITSDWQYDEERLSQWLRDPDRRDAALAELAEERRRKARVFLLYARALSRDGQASDCASARSCTEGVGTTPVPERSACERLRDLACLYSASRGRAAGPGSP